MNIRARHAKFKVWEGARADIDRVLAIWRDCLETYGGPYLFGKKPTMADAMYAPVCTRLLSYDVDVDAVSARYCDTIMALAPMAEWVAAAHGEPEEVEELDIEF
jgi:glutathione S-transferase